MSSSEKQDITYVSVIIPNLNCCILDQTLKALYAQSLEPHISVEIIVVGQDEPGCLLGFPEVVYIPTEQPVGPATARNMGITRASGNLIACIDADCIADTHWISEMITAHRQCPKKTIVGGSIRIDDRNLWALADNLASFYAYLPNRRPAIYPVLPTCNVSMRREAFEKVGLFDESLLVSEDVDWMMRARRMGFSLYFYPRARVWHRSQRRALRLVLLHAATWGYHSIVNRHRYADMEPLPVILKYWWGLALGTPLLALAVTTKIFVGNPALWRYVYALPVVLMAKLAWCWGATCRLKEGIP